MAWIIPVSESTSLGSTPNYGSVSTKNITETSTEIIAAGNNSRFATISSSLDSANIYISYETPVNLETKTFNYIIPPGFQHHKLELPAQAIHAATEAGKTATLIRSISE